MWQINPCDQILTDFGYKSKVDLVAKFALANAVVTFSHYGVKDFLLI